MQTAKLFMRGKQQAVCLPSGCKFDETEVGIKCVGDMVILFPKSKVYELFREGVNGFSDDFMAEGRGDAGDLPRDSL